MDTEILKLRLYQGLSEDLRKWFKDGGWNRYNTKGEKVGKCARDDKDGDGKADGPKPKCLPASKAASLGKKKVAAAVKRKRSEDPNPNRTGAAKNVKTESTEIELRVGEFMEACWKGYEKKGMKTMFGKRYPNCVKKTRKEEVELKTEGYGVSPNMDPSVPKSHNERMRDAREKSKKQGVFLPPWIGPELPRVKAKSKIQVSHYEPEGEMVSERSRLDGPEERKKDLDKRYDPKGGGKNPFQYVPVKQAMVKKEEVDIIDEKFKSQYGDKTKLSQSSERKSLGRGSSIKDGSKKRGYESKKEFRDQSMKLRKHRERFGDLAKESVSEGKSDGDPCWDSHKQVGMKKKGGKMVPNCVPKEEVEVQSEGAAWTKKSGKNSEGGLNEKGRKSYERENPGSDLKGPSKKVGNKRRASFCARMKGMRKRQKPSNNTGEDRLSKSLRAWNC